MPHYIHLTDEEDLILLQLSQSTAPRRIRMRAEVLRLSHRRWTAPRIAEFLHCDLKTVRETFRRWWDAGFEGLNEQEGRGRKARWSEEDLDFLAQQMSENPQTYTTEQLVQLLKTQRQVDLSPSYLSRLLKKKGLRGSGSNAVLRK